MSLTPEVETLFATLRQTANATVAQAIQAQVETVSDRDLCRINPWRSPRSAASTRTT